MARVTDHYVQSARDYHDSNAEHERALHQHYIDALDGLSEGAKQHLIDSGAADVVAHLHANSSERMALSAMATADRQVPALQKIRKRLAGGGSGEEHDNERTDRTLSERGKLPTHHGRVGLRR